MICYCKLLHEVPHYPIWDELCYSETCLLYFPSYASNQWCVEKYFSCLSFGVLDFYFIILFHLTVQFAKSTVKSCSISSFIHSGHFSFGVWQILFVHHPNLKGSLKSNSPTSITQYSLFFFYQRSLLERIFYQIIIRFYSKLFLFEFLQISFVGLTNTGTFLR